jgi:hypothetical protein
MQVIVGDNSFCEQESSTRRTHIRTSVFGVACVRSLIARRVLQAWFSVADEVVASWNDPLLAVSPLLQRYACVATTDVAGCVFVCESEHVRCDLTLTCSAIAARAYEFFDRVYHNVIQEQQ